MVVSAYKIYDEFKAYIVRKGAPYGQWYVGITSNAQNCLFMEHSVSEKQDIWMYKECSHNRHARNISNSLMNLGCDGAAGGWDSATNIVFAYLKSPNTFP